MFRFLIFIGGLLMTTAAMGESTAAIGGYSPVSYFTKGEPEMGSPEFTVEYEGSVYHLADASQVEVFNTDPEKYRPRYDICPYSLSLGMRKPLDPTNFKILGGHLLLFHKSEEMDGLAAFAESGLSDEELLDRADKQYVLLRF